MATGYQKRRRAQEAAAIVGVDAGKNRHALAIRPQHGEDSRPFLFETTRAEFEQAVAEITRVAPTTEPQNVLVGIEFAGNYGFTFAHFLRDRGFQVVSVAPADSKSWNRVVHRQRLKTDAKDALTITNLAANGFFMGFPFLDQNYADLRYLVSARERLTKLRTGTIARLKELLQVTWPEFERRFPNFKKATPIALLQAYPTPHCLMQAPKRKALKLIREASLGKHGVALYDELMDGARGTVALAGAHSVMKNEIALQLEMLETCERQIAQVEELMVAALERTPEGAPLLSIPGMGPVTAAVFLGSIGDPQTYESSRQALRVAGMSLVVRESGNITGQPRLSKSGRPEMRRQAYMFAVRSVTARGMFRMDYERLLVNNGGRKIPALVAISRKAVKLMFRIARDRRLYTPEPPK